jgi:uncharacterized membrane protein/ribosomal protein L40E
MTAICPECDASLPDDAVFCAECGADLRPIERAHGKVGALPEIAAGALAYCVAPIVVFLTVPPYRRNRFVRFHCFQCAGLLLGVIVVTALLWLLGSALGLIPVLGLLLISTLAGLAFFVLWAVMVIKALQGEMLKLPLVGDFAEAQAALA